MFKHGFILVLLVLLCLVGPVGAWQEKSYPASVVTVIDGDTVEVVIYFGDKLFRAEVIRLAEIDAPERGRPGHNEATTYLKSRVFDKQVVLVVEEKGDGDAWRRGKFGRVIGRVMVDGRDVGREMLEKGLVKSYGTK